MSIIDKKGINVTSGFKLVSGQPIDARFVVEDETELESLITNGAVYEGLHVWVKSLGKEKVWNGTKFAESQTSGSSTVSYESEITSGTKIGTLTINGTEYQVLIPNIGSGGGSNVSYTSKLTEGINIGTLAIDGNTYELYAPETNNNASVDLSKLDLDIQEGTLNIVNNGVTVGNGVEVERLNKNIVEIETLPEYKLVGNVIPSEGLIEKIYFNQNLSVEKMLEIFRSLDYVDDFTGSSSKCYYITATSLSLTGNTVFYIELNGGSEENGYNFILLPPSGYPTLLYHLDVNEMTGQWYVGLQYYEANVNVITSTLAGYIGQTMQNEKLTDLLSLGEFNKDYSEVANKNTIYKVLEDNSYKILDGENFKNIELEQIVYLEYSPSTGAAESDYYYINEKDINKLKYSSVYLVGKCDMYLNEVFFKAYESNSYFYFIGFSGVWDNSSALSFIKIDPNKKDDKGNLKVETGYTAIGVETVYLSQDSNINYNSINLTVSINGKYKSISLNNQYIYEVNSLDDLNNAINTYPANVNLYDNLINYENSYIILKNQNQKEKNILFGDYESTYFSSTNYKYIKTNIINEKLGEEDLDVNSYVRRIIFTCSNAEAPYDFLEIAYNRIETNAITIDNFTYNPGYTLRYYNKLDLDSSVEFDWSSSAENTQKGYTFLNEEEAKKFLQNGEHIIFAKLPSGKSYKHCVIRNSVLYDEYCTFSDVYLFENNIDYKLTKIKIYKDTSLNKYILYATLITI